MTQQRMISHLVPDFHQIMENDYSISNSSGPKKPATGEEGIMELLWKNGHVVMQNQRQSKKAAEVEIPPEREIRLLGAEEQQQQLFMQEDEMASWIQYPLDDLYADLLYPVPSPPPPIPTITQPRVLAEIRSPPLPLRRTLAPALTMPDDAPRLQNFVHFSRLPAKPRTETAVESTMVQPEARVSHGAQPNVERGASATAGESAAGTCELTVLSSSPGGSRGSFSSEGHQPQQRPAEDWKRKAREKDDDEYQSEDIFEFEAAEPKKTARGSTSTKRSRAAEVHNQSERRRRDRINEKMRALQELIPRCNKSDKASMLDEAIEYLKSLQMQVQMMSSMGCPMVPMMYPGMQQYMPAMGLGMGVNRPMLPYPSIPNPAHMGPRFPMMLAPYRMPLVPVADPSRAHASKETDHPVSVNQYQNQPRMPNLVDPYQQFVGMRFPLPQNQAVSQPGANKPSSRGILDNQQ